MFMNMYSLIKLGWMLFTVLSALFLILAIFKSDKKRKLIIAVVCALAGALFYYIGMNLEEKMEKCSHESVEVISYTAPNKITLGKRITKCDACWKVFNETIEYHEHNYTSEVDCKATCEEDGVLKYVCDCGDEYTEPIKAIGHSGKERIIRKSTLDKAGEKEINCDNCGEKVVVELPLLGENKDIPVEIDAATLYRNRGDKYAGKWIEVSGTVLSISDSGGYYLYGKTGQGVCCFVNGKQAAKEKTWVKMLGYLRDPNNDNVELTQCEITHGAIEKEEKKKSTVSASSYDSDKGKTNVSAEAELMLSMIAEDMAKQVAQNPGTVKMSVFSAGFARDGHEYAVQNDFTCSNLLGVTETHTIQVWCTASDDYSKIQPHKIVLDGKVIVDK